MTRTQNTPVTKRRRKKILEQAEGYFGSKHKLFKTAQEQVNKSWIYAYRDRKKNKSFWRQVWTIRLNNASRKEGLKYSRLIHLLKLSQIKLNRRQLEKMPEEKFTKLVTERQRN